MVLLLLTFCLLFLALWESVIVLCSVVRSSIAIILMKKRELVALLNLSFWCLVMVEWLFLAVPRGWLGLVIQLFLFVCFVALRPKSTAMAIAGRSVHLTTLFPGQA